MEIRTLNLLSPIYYFPAAEPNPFDPRENGSGGEKLYCFELNESDLKSFEPDKSRIFSSMVFGGDAAGEPPKKNGETLLKLPKGNYLFVQKREILCKDDIIAMAVEIQLEGLWQRLELGKKLYLRYLYEDSSGVTQLFRPYD